MTHLHPIGMLMVCLFITALLPAQDSISPADKVLSFPTRFLDKINNKTSRLEEKIISKSEHTLKRLSRQERRLQRKLLKKDSALAKQLFQDGQERYQSFQSQLTSKVNQIAGRKEYIPFIDTLATSIRFLEKSRALQDNKLIQQTLGQVNNMQSRFEQAAQIQQYLRNRRQYLKDHLSKLGMAKELKRYSKQAYYYRLQIQEYKSILKEPQKIERKAIDLLSKTKPFQEFMSRYSILGSLFSTGNYLSPPAGGGAGGGLPGLQTRAQVNTLIQQSAGSAGPNNAAQILQQGVQQAQAQLQEIKNNINEMGANSDGELPEFRRNSQRAKSFWNRWELGTNIQSTRSNNFLPACTQVGVSAGFKLNDQSIIGIGMAGNIGLGKDIKHIAISYEGAAARSFLDWKIKGSFWVSAGYEMIYKSAFNRIEQLKVLNAWQQSGLLGISKKYKVGKKLKGKMSLLWDYLSYEQVPRTQPVVFRFGYSIK